MYVRRCAYKHQVKSRAQQGPWGQSTERAGLAVLLQQKKNCAGLVHVRRRGAYSPFLSLPRSTMRRGA